MTTSQPFGKHWDGKFMDKLASGLYGTYKDNVATAGIVENYQYYENNGLIKCAAAQENTHLR